MKRSLLLALLVTFGLVLSACTGGTDDDTDGGATADLSYDLVDTAYADIGGTVEFTELDNGDIQATIDLGTTAQADSSYPAHIHAGDAGSGGAIVVPLENVVDGESVTTFSELEDGTAVTIESLEAYDGYVNIHLTPDDLDIVVASANIGANIDVEVPTPDTIAEVATASEGFTTLLAALTQAELADTFAADGGPYTVLAPTDEAFTDLLTELGATAEELLARDDLADILSYHVIDGAVPRSAVIAAATANADVDTLLTDDPISLALDGEAIIIDERATVNAEATNLVASNGIIHVIDTVLIPNGEVEAETTTYDLDATGATLSDGVTVTDVSGTATFTKLSDTETEITLTLENTVDGVQHPAHIHVGDTEDSGAIYVTLGPVDGTMGESTITVTETDEGAAITYEELIAYDGYINIHESADALGVVVANGEVGANAEGESEED